MSGVAAIGAGLAAYLGWLKLLARPCAGGGCDAILFSAYGEFLGLPIGYWGVALWAAVVLGNGLVRRVAALALALGAGWLMFIQFVVLRGFCGYCTVHAGCALAAGALAWWGAQPRLRILAIPLLLPLPLLALSGPPESPRPQAIASAAAPVSAAPDAATVRAGDSLGHGPALRAAEAGLAFGWLTRQRPADSHLVLSLTCHHCVDLLLAAAREPGPAAPQAPGVLLGVAPRAFELNQEIVAATLLFDDPVRGFREVFGWLAPVRDHMIGNRFERVSEHLRQRFPDVASKHLAAEQILMDQERALLRLPIRSTPLLIRGEEYIYATDSALLRAEYPGAGRRVSP